MEMKEEEEENKSRKLSKEKSFRVYYGGVHIGVPFVWEAKPGTPKHPFSNSLSPPPFPLTPPPSYYQSKTKSFSSSSSSNKIFHGLFPKIIMRRHRRHLSSASSTLSSSSSKDLGSVSSPPGWMFHPDLDSDEEVGDDILSPRSILCFGLRATRKIH